MTAWWRAIVVSHRWLGIAGWLVFIMWLATGIVMMYARMPAFSRAERFATLAPLDLSDARLSPSDALRSQRIVDPQRVVVAMLTGRPVYRVLARGISTTVFADNGEPLDRLSPDQALDEVRRFAPESAATIRYEARMTEPDQWTLEEGAALPLHRVTLGDADDRVFYLAERTGEIVGKTTRRERWLAFAGAVPHWLYFTPLRRHRGVWAESIIWMSAAGSVMCLLGLAWGVFCGITRPAGAPSAAHARGWQRGTRVGVAYRGCMRWHHYAGLTFGNGDLHMVLQRPVVNGSIGLACRYGANAVTTRRTFWWAAAVGSCRAGRCPAGRKARGASGFERGRPRPRPHKSVSHERDRDRPVFGRASPDRRRPSRRPHRSGSIAPSGARRCLWERRDRSRVARRLRRLLL